MRAKHLASNMTGLITEADGNGFHQFTADSGSQFTVRADEITLL